jgi:hypothetical protein
MHGATCWNAAMDAEGIALVVLVFGSLALFGIVLAGVSWWSRSPGK